MGKNNKNQSLSWDAFQSLGNPDNAPDEEVLEDKVDIKKEYAGMTIRIWLDRKKGGKVATIIKGITLNQNKLKDLAKQIKSKCGVGGSSKDGQIIIQGDKRKKVQEILIAEGFPNVKLAGG